MNISLRKEGFGLYKYSIYLGYCFGYLIKSNLEEYLEKKISIKPNIDHSLKELHIKIG